MVERRSAQLGEVIRSLALAALFATHLCAGCKPAGRVDPAAVIDYRGETIRLTKRYDDFDAYKNDPSNIAPEEYSRVRRLVEAAPVPEHCADIREIIRASSASKFPGYGLGGVGDPHSDDRSRVVGESIEIPHADANRFVIYLKEVGGYALVDDTVLSEPPYIDGVTVSDGKVTYQTREGAVVAQRPIRDHGDH
jgi:hypothetical protein